MNSTRKSSTATHTSWIANVLSDIRLGQRRLVEHNRVPRTTPKR